ncbi:hypothetical protein OIU76_013227 [Salix suchowensis]|nr:hypothetical protein OIU76_013227 [Salix suchowensis]KAJ6350224.1 hypothetical protein OIU78_006401 [Salix suchowensis]
MLSSPNDESPANVDAAKQWRDSREEFRKKVIGFHCKKEVPSLGMMSFPQGGLCWSYEMDWILEDAELVMVQA